MDKNLKKEMLHSIELTRENLKNTMEISLENYAEIISKLDMLTYMILSEDKKSYKV